MARTFTINITDISLRPYGLTSPLALEFPAFDRFDARTEFAALDGMTHLAVAFKASNLKAHDGSMRKSRHTFWVNICDCGTDIVISSRTVYVEMQPWEEDMPVRIDIPLRMSQLIENRFYYVNITAPGCKDGTPIIYKEFRMVSIDNLAASDFFNSKWGALAKAEFSSAHDKSAILTEHYITALSDESNRDWMLILAGYTEPMMRLFDLNPGLRSRIPDMNLYMFDDFTEHQLMEIAERYLSQRQFVLSDEARQLLQSRLQSDYQSREKDFGNARHVVNLVETGIFPAMARRLCGVQSPTVEQLSLIEASDIPVVAPVVPRHTAPRPGFRMRG